MDGPIKAPSSPPETPVPIYRSPWDSNSFIRRDVSVYKLFPPSMMTSPLDRSGINWSITWSTGLPALTISMTLRGTFKLATSSLMSVVPPNCLPCPRPFKKLSTVSCFREETITEKPFDSMFKAKFSPMTAMPMRPISYVIVFTCFIVSKRTSSLTSINHWC